MDTRMAERGSSAFLLAFAIIVCWASLRLSVGTLEQPGSGFFPLIGGGVLAVLSGANLIKSTRANGNRPSAKFDANSINWKSVLLALGIMAAFPFLLDILGFAPTTFVFFVLLLRLIEPQRWVVTLSFAVLSAVFFHLLFQVWIKMKFPIGMLGI